MKVKQKKKNIPILNVIILVLIFTVTLLCGCSSNIETQPKIVISDKFLTINLEEDISQTASYPNFLSESRKLNLDFFVDVKKIINEIGN